VRTAAGAELGLAWREPLDAAPAEARLDGGALVLELSPEPVWLEPAGGRRR